MNAKVNQTPANNLNPLIIVSKDGTVISSNDANEPILNEWGIRVGEKLPSNIVYLVQRVISRNSPEKMEVKVGKKVYLVVFSPLPEKECVNISGFDTNDHKELEKVLESEAQEESEHNALVEELRKSEERFRSAFYDSVVAMALVCPDARLYKVNDSFCRMLGFEKSEMEGRTFIDFTYPDDIEPSILTHKAVINREKPFFWLEKRYIRKDGRVIWCEVSSSPVFDSKGCPIYTVAHIQDITERKKAEKALKEREQLYRSVFDYSQDGFVLAESIYDENGKSIDGLVLKVNQAFEVQIGIKASDIVGKRAKEIDSNLDPQWFETQDKVLKTRQSTHIEIYQQDTKRYYDVYLFPYSNNRFGELFRDITERKEIENKIRHLANVVESSSDAIGTLSLDGITTSWNKGAEQIYGYSAEEILGKHISLPAPSHLKNETQEYIELIKQTGMAYRYTTSRLRKDGEMINVSITLSPVFDSHGKLTAISFISRDITDQIKSEEKLRKSEEKYRNIVETANEGIGIIDSRGIVTFANKKLWDMLGYSVEEGYNKSAYDLVEDKDEFKKKQEGRSKGFNETYELKVVRKDGSKMWVTASVKPLFNNKGEYTGSLGMFTDITKRKEAEETLKKIEIARKQEIHHRIKNNLQVISSMLDLQADKIKQKNEITKLEVLEAFRESQDRVISMALIHEELYKGGEIDKLNFSRYIVELAENLFLSYRIGNEGINLEMDIEEDILFDMDTAVPLGIIINELLSNSLKYAFVDRDNGEIKIKLQRDETGECKIKGNKSANYVLSVGDNGIGIPEDLDIEDLDSLGLQLIITLVEQLDGELKLRRDNGTEFIFRFIVTEKDNQAPGQASQLVE